MKVKAKIKSKSQVSIKDSCFCTHRTQKKVQIRESRKSPKSSEKYFLEKYKKKQKIFSEPLLIKRKYTLVLSK